jgi:vacuolar-type H+-ATPase subunit H
VSAPAAASPPASVEVLKRIKATETEWDGKVSEARRESEQSLARLRTENDAAIREAQADVEARRTQSIATAQLEVEREATQILDAGRRDAESVAKTAGKQPTDRREEVLAAVLGPLAGS